ncbi:universal stress protein [Streptomyces sp. NPDC006733]|uniref:universal stress protein n=1 Tax=Streptomyces sp. NPDC006733 TaxID=3155460 RepID=UPI0033DAE68D
MTLQDITFFASLCWRQPVSTAIAVGLDGSAASMASAHWAAREALRKDLPVRLVHVWNWQPRRAEAPAERGARRRRAQQITREAAVRLRGAYPSLKVVTDQMGGQPGAVLPVVAEEAELLVLGSHKVPGLAGFRIGSAALATAACAERPVIVTRAGRSREIEQPAAAPGTGSKAARVRDVVLGLDLARACEDLLEFAFATALARAATLHVINGRAASSRPQPGERAPGLEPSTPAPPRTRSQDLTEMLRPWKEKFPEVAVVEEAVPEGPVEGLLEAAHGASLLIVGRRASRLPSGWRLGPTALAMLHHCAAPVAVVPYT